MIKDRHSQHGFTLVEVLVALIVMAVGMLGVAALYIEGLRSGSSSVARSNAVSLAADMADRIRANPNAAADYAAGGPGSANQNCVSENGAVICTPTQLAEDDWFWWYQDVQNRLPGGSDAQINTNPAGAPIVEYTITLNWSEAGQGADAAYSLVFSQ